mmetsp:Transcript_14230/g.26692  ORF Transcript_14230/g.26692 Transcript_14230/m.26692 type:complete len:316 (+) Transcript_14230:981-1928(+)
MAMMTMISQMMIHRHRPRNRFKLFQHLHLQLFLRCGRPLLILTPMEQLAWLPFLREKVSWKKKGKSKRLFSRHKRRLRHSNSNSNSNNNRDCYRNSKLVSRQSNSDSNNYDSRNNSDNRRLYGNSKRQLNSKNHSRKPCKDSSRSYRSNKGSSRRHLQSNSSSFKLSNLLLNKDLDLLEHNLVVLMACLLLVLEDLLLETTILSLEVALFRQPSLLHRCLTGEWSFHHLTEILILPHRTLELWTYPSFIVPRPLTVNVNEPILLEILIQHHPRIQPLQVLSLIIQKFSKSSASMPYSLFSIIPKALISSILLPRS